MVNRKTVLIVDDDQGVREMLQDFLASKGYATVAAADGKEGIEALKRIEPPAVVLLDLSMPVMNGWQFLEARKNDASIAGMPVVVLSAVADEKVKDSGATDYLSKPVDMLSLLAMIDSQFA